MVAGSIFENSFDRVDQRITELYAELRAAHNLDGLVSYERFLAEGFHASVDTFEVKIPFVNLLRSEPGFSTYVFLSDGPAREDLGPIATLAVLYGELVTTILGRLRDSPSVRLIFEENPDLNRSFGVIAEAARTRVGFSGRLVVQRGRKRQPHSLAVTDYVMHIFKNWYAAGASRSPNDHLYRDWLAVRGHVSVVRSLQEGTLYRRGQPVVGEREGGRRALTSQDNARDSRTQDDSPLSETSISAMSSEWIGVDSVLRPIGYAVHHVQALADGIRQGTAYVVRRIPKRRGGSRIVHMPSVELRSLLRLLHRQLESTLAYESHPAVYGYVPGRNIVGNAARHLGQAVVLCVDLKDFFGSIDRQMVVEALQRNGCDPELRELLAEVLTVNGVLPAGFSTSPFLSNVVFEETDEALAKIAENAGVVYSRFADDLTFSGELDDRFLEIVTDVLTDRGWSLNEKKTRFMRRGGPQYVTGLYVGTDAPRISRRTKRRIRTQTHYIGLFGYQDHLEHAREPQMIHCSIRGWLHYAQQLEPKFVNDSWNRLRGRKPGTLQLVRTVTDPAGHWDKLLKVAKLDPSL